MFVKTEIWHVNDLCVFRFLKMMQKLSTRMPVLEVRMKVLKEIAAENNIVLTLEETSSVSIEVWNFEELRELRED